MGVILSVASVKRALDRAPHPHIPHPHLPHPHLPYRLRRMIAESEHRPGLLHSLRGVFRRSTGHDEQPP